MIKFKLKLIHLKV